MKWTCKHSDLIGQVQNSLGFTQAKGSFSIYGNIYLNLKGNELEIKATNMNYGYRSVVEVQGEGDGVITVQGDRFTEMVKNLKEEESLSFETDDEFLYISSVMSSVMYKIRYVSAEAFEYNDMPETDCVLSVPRDMLVELACKTIMSVCENEDKLNLCGIYAEFHSDSITFVSTDSKCLTYYKKDFACSDSVDGKKMTIPTKFIRDMIKITPSGGTLELGFNDNMLQIGFGNSSMWTMLIKEKFPAFGKILEVDYRKSVSLPVQELNRMLRHVIIMCDGESKKILFRITNGKISLFSVGGEDLGRGEDEMACEYDGEDTEFTICYTYLLDQLREMTSSDIKLSFNSAKAPIKVEPLPALEYSATIMTMSV